MLFHKPRSHLQNTENALVYECWQMGNVGVGKDFVVPEN